jgi:hypothetical protein
MENKDRHSSALSLPFDFSPMLVDNFVTQHGRIILDISSLMHSSSFLDRKESLSFDLRPIRLQSGISIIELVGKRISLCDFLADITDVISGYLRYREGGTLGRGLGFFAVALDRTVGRCTNISRHFYKEDQQYILSSTLYLRSKDQPNAVFSYSTWVLFHHSLSKELEPGK